MEAAATMKNCYVDMHQQRVKKVAGKDICALHICKCNAATKLHKYTKKYKRCHPSAPVLKCSIANSIGLKKSQP